MSINVTVTGNPVSIKRGKMVCCDPKKDEFEKRRLMRLEQVRQQSKDIAQNVRNKVRKEKCKQVCQIEKEGKEKLKKWQARKLLELQNQYREAIKDIGQGHKEALHNENDSDVILEEKERNDRKSRERGQQAAEKLQIEKNKTNYKQALPRQQRKISREIEDTRAAMVSGLNKKGRSPFKKKKKRKRSIANVHITNDEIYDSDFNNTDIPKLDLVRSESSDETNDVGIQATSSSSSSSTEDDEDESDDSTIHKETSEDSRKITKDDFTREAQKTDYAKRDPVLSVNTKEQQTSSTLLNQAYRQEIPTQTYTERMSGRHHIEVPVDTRISDRIKNRPLLLVEPEVCNATNRICLCDSLNVVACSCFKKQSAQLDKQTSYSDVNSRKPLSSKHSREQQQDDQDIRRPLSSRHSGEQPSERVIAALQDEIPAKPKIVLESSKDKLAAQSSASSKVSQYDHGHRFSKEMVDNRSHVEKIGEDSIRLSPGNGSDIQYFDKMYQRDKDAQIRGQKALEKERIHKDYRELMKKLPALQKQERICEISSDKPEYHMSEERLRERERMRQNRMENAYQKSFPQRKPAVVTIPPKAHEKVDVNVTPFKVVDTTNGSPSLNLGQWDIESHPPKEPRKVPDEKNRRTQLKELLEGLQDQKRLLLEEIKALPKDSNLDGLLESFSALGAEIEERKGTKKSDRRKPSPAWEPRQEDPAKARGSRVEDGANELEHKSRSKERHKHRKSPSDRQSSVVTDEPQERSLSRDEKRRKRHEKCFTSENTAGSRSPSPQKKSKTKYKKRIIILQNCSTQTTPISADGVETRTTDKKVKTTDNEIEARQAFAKSGIDKDGKPTRSEVDANQLPPASSAPKIDKKVCTKTHIPCDCNKAGSIGQTEDLCQIVIKIKDDKKPEIVIQPENKTAVRDGDDEKISEPTTQSRSETKTLSSSVVHRVKTKDHKHKEKSKHGKKKSKKHVEIDHGYTQQEAGTSEQSEKKKEFKKVSSDPTGVKVKADAQPKPGTTKLWRDTLLQNSSEETTTSYYSPPDFMKKRAEASKSLPSRPTPSNLLPCNYEELLRQRPQQRNLQESASTNSDSASKTPRSLDPQLVRCIKKLLSMSRRHAAELPVSTVSEASTPSQSIINTESNQPIDKLHNILRCFNLDVAEFQQLTYSSDGSNSRLQGHENVTLSSSDGSQVFSQNKHFEKHFRKKGTSEEGPASSDVRPKTSTDSGMTRHVSEYSEIAESCNRRISDLNTLIEKVREEKEKMLQSPVTSDHDHSTKYLTVPPCGICSSGNKEKVEDQDQSSSSSSSIDEELQRKLLNVDRTLADHFKRMNTDDLKRHESKEKVQEKVDNVEETDDSLASMSDSDRQLFIRLQNLLNTSHKTVADARMKLSGCSAKPKTVAFCLTDSPPKNVGEAGDTGFVPMLADIPKLPILTSLAPTFKALSSELEGGNTSNRRPPPSKGLSIVKRLNGQLDALPHELSTIIEADSQMSTRIEQSPRASKESSSTPRKIRDESEKSGDRSKSSSQSNPLEQSTVASSPQRTIEDSGNKSKSSSPSKDSAQTPRNEKSGDRIKVSSHSKGAIQTPRDESKLSSGTDKDRATSDRKNNKTSNAMNGSADKSSDTDESLRNLFKEIKESLGIISDTTSSQVVEPRGSADQSNSKVIDLSPNVMKISTSSSSDDKIDTEAVENMLHSIGMDWAITTLRKTREALALSSSTSSLDLKMKKSSKAKSSSSSSEVSLKEFLISQMTSKVSSSTSKSEITPTGVSQNVDLSVVQYSEERSKRTSTPIQSLSFNRTGSSKGGIFSGESDISSVRDHSREIEQYHQTPTFCTLSSASMRKSRDEAQEAQKR